MSEITAGTVIDRYIVGQPIGKGGMSTVYRATDKVLGREIALKILSADGNNNIVRILIQEAIAASSLNHPNILTIYDVGEYQGHHYIAMELVEGGTLRDRLLRGPLEPSEAFKLALQIAEGLSSAHTHGIIHRDIKPENIIIRRDNCVKILDFGLAKIEERDPSDSSKRIDPMSMKGAWIGTINYMSPEQVRGDDVDARSDIFALGVVVYEMITGKHPFTKDNITETMQAILKQPHQLPSSFSRAIPTDFDLLINKSLAKRREERYQNALEFGRALKLLISDNQSSSTSTLPLELPTGSQAAMIAAAVESMSEGEPEGEAISVVNFIGRASGIEQLLLSFERTATHGGEVVFITGETGQGKSTLIKEFRRRVGTRASFLALRLYQESAGLPFAPFLDAIGDLLNHSEIKSAGKQIFYDIFGEYTGEVEEALKSHDLLLASYLLQLQGGADQMTRSFETLRRCLISFAQLKPIICCFDNLQWADASTLEAISYFSKNLQQYPIMLLGAVRSEDLAGNEQLKNWLTTMSGPSHYPVIRLVPFNRAEMGAMVMHLCPGIEASSQLIDTLFAQTGGNPYFAREMVMLWQEDGTITRENGRWRVARIETGSLPRSTADLIELRLQSLNESSRQLLAQATVIGSEFSLSLLQQISRFSEAELRQILERLEQARLIVEISSDETVRYTFHPVAIQQVLYRRLSDRQLKELHKKVADALQALHGTKLEKVYAQLAYHYRAAGHAESAFRFSVMAAEQERRAGLIHEQSKYLDWANEASADLPTDVHDRQFLRVVAIYRLNAGHVASLRGKLDVARDNLDTALALSERINDEPLKGSIQIVRAWMHLLATDYIPAQQAFAAAISIFEKAGDNAQRLEALSGFAVSKSFDVKELERASRWLLAVAGSSSYAKGFAYTTLALSYLQTGLLGHTVDYYHRSIQHFEKAGERAQLARTLSLLGSVYAQRRQFELASENCQRGLEMAAQINVFAELIARNSMVAVLLHRNEIDTAQATAREVLQMSERAGNKLYLSMAYLELGRIDHYCGQYENAIKNYRQAIKLFDGLSYRYRQAEADALLGSCYLVQGQYDVAMLCCRRGIELARKDHFRHPYWQSAFVIAQALLARGNQVEAKSYLREAHIALNEMVADLPPDAATSFLSDKAEVLRLCKEYE